MKYVLQFMAFLIISAVFFVLWFGNSPRSLAGAVLFAAGTISVQIGLDRKERARP